MSLFEDGSSEIHHFPTLPAFICPVIVKEAEQYGKGHKGVFALAAIPSVAAIPSGTKFWVWTDRVQSIHHTELEDYIAKNIGDENVNLDDIQLFLRQGFVLPPSEKGTGKEDQYFYTNPTDAGRFMNHSSNANCGPDGAVRDIQAGEEMTMDYSFHGNPAWYQDICKKYGVLTEQQVASQVHVSKE
jgi:hypothetical protein